MRKLRLGAALFLALLSNTQNGTASDIAELIQELRDQVGHLSPEQQTSADALRATIDRLEQALAQTAAKPETAPRLDRWQSSLDNPERRRRKPPSAPTEPSGPSSPRTRGTGAASPLPDGPIGDILPAIAKPPKKTQASLDQPGAARPKSKAEMEQQEAVEDLKSIIPAPQEQTTRSKTFGQFLKDINSAARTGDKGTLSSLNQAISELNRLGHKISAAKTARQLPEGEYTELKGHLEESLKSLTSRRDDLSKALPPKSP